MAQKFQEDPQDPALKAAGFDRGWESAKYVIKNTAITALKGAVIGALVFAAVVSPIGAAMGAGNWLMGLAGFTSNMSPMLMFLGAAAKGMLAGGLLAAAWGLFDSFNTVGDKMEDQEQSIVLKSKRAKQMEINEKVLEMGLAGIPQQPSMGINSLSHGLGGLGAQKATENAYATTV